MSTSDAVPGSGGRTRERVLVVDDEKDVRDLLALALEALDYEVACAADGIEALEKLQARPDLMLLDLAMPRVDGWEVLRRLRGRPDRPSVLILTGRGDGRAFMNTFREGAAAFMAKPFRLDALGATCRTILRARRQQGIAMTKRRREPRRDFVMGVTLLSSGGAGLVSGELVNLSRHGARLRVEAPLPEERALGFEIRAALPEPALRFAGRVRWVAARPEGRFHGIALQDGGSQTESALDALFSPPA